MSLSLTYIVLIIVTLIIGLVLLALAAVKGNVIGLFLIGSCTGVILFTLVSIGTKYGQYGLEILIAKSLQKKHIKNDFPRMEQNLSHQAQLFPMQTLTKELSNHHSNKQS